MNESITPSSEQHSAGLTDSLDAIAGDLRILRIRAGEVSYSALATQISAARQAAGCSPAAARVARTTVFDAFREGRRRVNVDLVAEIVIALGESPESAERWRQRCIRAREQAELASQSGHRLTRSPQAARPVAAARTPPVPAHPVRLQSQLNPDLSRTTRASRNDHALTVGAFDHRKTFVFILLVSCVGINIFGNTVTMKYGLPVFLDMIGTAIAAIALGPWYGAAVAIVTGATTSLSGAPVSMVFSIVGVAGALAWGYGFHRFGLGRTPLRFLLLNLGTGLLCTLFAAPITIFAFGGTVTHASNSLTESLLALGEGIWLAVFSANLLSSLADKLISGYLALLATRLIGPQRLVSRRTGYFL